MNSDFIHQVTEKRENVSSLSSGSSNKVKPKQDCHEIQLSTIYLSERRLLCSWLLINARVQLYNFMTMTKHSAMGFKLMENPKRLRKLYRFRVDLHGKCHRHSTLLYRFSPPALLQVTSCKLLSLKYIFFEKWKSIARPIGEFWTHFNNFQQA